MSIKIIEEFDDYPLKEDLLKGIYSYGFEKPSSIQQKGIPAILSGKDIIAQSQSGTGKTATFCISALQLIEKEKEQIQVIIISNVRELAEQSYKVISSLNNFLNYNIKLLIGGNNHNINNLNESHIIICTPGKLLKMIYNNIISLNHLKLLVIDEADEMLDDKAGFMEQIKNIINNISKNTQIVLTSATLKKNTLSITEKFMNDPLKIIIKNNELTLEGISQFYILLNSDMQKLDCLIDIYSSICVSSTIIFCNSKKKVEWLTNQLKLKNFAVKCINGDIDQKQRNEIFNDFVKGTFRIIISTDIWARGIDISSVGFVINFDLPYKKESYIHRIGRSGRYGKKGIAINFINDKEYYYMKKIEEYYSTQILEMPINIESYL